MPNRGQILGFLNNMIILFLLKVCFVCFVDIITGITIGLFNVSLWHNIQSIYCFIDAITLLV